MSYKNVPFLKIYLLNQQPTKYKIYLLISYGNVVHKHTNNAVTALYKMIECKVVIFIILSDNAISYRTKQIEHNKGNYNSFDKRRLPT